MTWGGEMTTRDCRTPVDHEWDHWTDNMSYHIIGDVAMRHNLQAANKTDPMALPYSI